MTTYTVTFVFDYAVITTAVEAETDDGIVPAAKKTIESFFGTNLPDPIQTAIHEHRKAHNDRHL